MDMRASTKVDTKPTKRVTTAQYVEGDSSAEDANGRVNGGVESDPETEEGDDGGSVEDVELGSEDSSEDEDEEMGSSDGHRGVNGFVDDEAEESLGEDDSVDESEDDDDEDDEHTSESE